MNSEFHVGKIFPIIFLICVFFTFLGCNTTVVDTDKERKEIDVMLNAWHSAAAKADYNTYFDYFAEDAVFIGTDATENWDKKSFMAWAKPIFDKGKAWDFKPLERHVYFDKSGKIAWFDELLSTRMKICRGSGVLLKTENEWKIKQYILSMTIPNDKTDSVISLKAPIEDSIINTLLKKE